MKFLFALIVLSFGAFFGKSQSAQAYNSQELFYLIDPGHKYTKTDIIKLYDTEKSKFTKTSQAINLRLATDKVWIVADSNLVKNNQVVSIKNPHIDQVHVYPYNGNKFLPAQITGDKNNYSNRSYCYVYPNIEYHAEAKFLILEISSTGPMKLPVSFYSLSGFWQIVQENVSFHFFYFGILIFTILLSFGVYSWVKNSLFLIHGFAVLATALITAFNYGYLFKVFWPENPEINQFAILCLSLSVLNLLFVEKLLNLKNNNKFLYYAFRVFYVFSIVVDIFCCFERNALINEALLIKFSLFPVLPVIAGIFTFRKIQTQIVIWYLIGAAMFFLSIAVYALLLSGIITLNIFTDNIVQIGSILEILFFNIALIIKMKHYQREQEAFLLKEKITLEQTISSRTLELTLKNKLIEQKNALLQNQQEILENTVRERTLELVNTNKELNDRNFRLEQFANVTAHNLRGPVATLLGLASIFNKKNLEDPLNGKIIENVQESATKVDSILRDLSTLLDNHQNAQSYLEKVNLESIFVEVMSLLKPEFEKSGGNISTDFSQEPACNAVPVYIKNIFYNLISNGLKYIHPNTTPQLEIKSYRKDNSICIEFQDQGIGINLKQFGEKLFKPYKRFHISYPGKGIGLYTCKTQIEAMGGSMQIQSIEDKGTCFTITLPRPMEDLRNKEFGMKEIIL